MNLSKIRVFPVICAMIGLVTGLLMSAAFGALVFAGYGAIIGWVIDVYARNIVPFDFKRLEGNAPRVIGPVGRNTTAKEDGSELSKTKLANMFAVLIGVFLVALFFLLISTLKTERTDRPQLWSTKDALINDAGIDVSPK